MLLVILFVVGVNGITLDQSEWIEGEQGSFYCSNPSAVIIRKNGVTITTCPVGFSCSPAPPNYSRIEKDGTKVTFIIPTVNRNRDSATWSCGGNTATVDVKVAVPSVSIMNKNSLIFTDGQTTSITCKTGVSYPPANITWSIGGTTTTGTTTTNNPDGTTTSLLQYNAKKADHNKILQCSADNGLNRTKSDSLTLNIRYLPTVRIKLVSPTVKTHPVGNLYVIEGQKLQLTCIVVDANPPVSSYTWRKDGVDIPGEQSSSFIITSVQKSDEGNYTCTASNNVVGKGISDSVQVIVEVPPEKNSTKIDRCLLIEVTALSNLPVICKWFINGQVSQDVSTVDSDGNEHTCKLSSNSDLTNIAHGDYYVNISNEVGFTSLSLTVPDGTDLYPFYLLIVQVLRIVIVILLLIIIIIGTGKGTNVTTIVSIITGVLIAVCVIILIYVLVHIVEVFWIIVSCIMVVFSILTAILIPIIHRLLTKKVEVKNVKSVFLGLMVLSAVVIIFSLALLIYISVILAQYDVCEEDNLIGGACLQAVDLLFTIGLTVLIYKKLGL